MRRREASGSVGSLSEIDIEVVLLGVKRFFPKVLIEKSIWCNL